MTQEMFKLLEAFIEALIEQKLEAQHSDWVTEEEIKTDICRDAIKTHISLGGG